MAELYQTIVDPHRAMQVQQETLPQQPLLKVIVEEQAELVAVLYIMVAVEVVLLQ